jgi:hypothetical protein
MTPAEAKSEIEKKIDELKRSGNTRWVNGIVGFVKNSQELLSLVQNFFPSENIRQSIWHFLRQENSLPLCKCGDPLSFYRFEYLATCGKRKCIQEKKELSYKRTLGKEGLTHHTQRKEFKEKIKKLYYESTGYEHPFQNPSVREAASETLKKRTGYEHPLQNPETVEKRKKTCIEKYGTLNFLHSENSAETMMKKWGCKNPMQNEEIREKVSRKMRIAKLEILREKLSVHQVELIDTVQNWIKMKCKCGKEFEMPNSSTNFFLRQRRSPCPICDPKAFS